MSKQRFQGVLVGYAHNEIGQNNLPLAKSCNSTMIDK